MSLCPHVGLIPRAVRMGAHSCDTLAPLWGSDVGLREVTATGFVTDHRVPVLRSPAEQVGAADLPPRVHEEPPGLSPRAPRTRLALPHLHVHARGVGPAGVGDIGDNLGAVQAETTPLPVPSCPLQAGAVGVQRPPAADDRGAPGDGARHPAHQLPLPGRGPGRWVLPWLSSPFHLSLSPAQGGHGEVMGFAGFCHSTVPPSLG